MLHTLSNILLVIVNSFWAYFNFLLVRVNTSLDNCLNLGTFIKVVELMCNFILIVMFLCLWIAVLYHQQHEFYNKNLLLVLFVITIKAAIVVYHEEDPKNWIAIFVIIAMPKVYFLVGDDFGQKKTLICCAVVTIVCIAIISQSTVDTFFDVANKIKNLFPSLLEFLLKFKN